jgi:hypothetical protein
MVLRRSTELVIVWRNPADNDGRTISMSPRQGLDLERELADNEVLTYLQMLSPDDLRRVSPLGWCKSGSSAR